MLGLVSTAFAQAVDLQTSWEEIVLLLVFLVTAEVATSWFGSSAQSPWAGSDWSATASTRTPHIYEGLSWATTLSIRSAHHLPCKLLWSCTAKLPRSSSRVFAETQILLNAVYVKWIEMKTTMLLHSLCVHILSIILITRYEVQA